MIALAMLASVVRRRQRLRARLGDRRLPLLARAPDPCDPSSPFQEGAAPHDGRDCRSRSRIVRPSSRRTRRRRVLRWVGKAPIHILLVFVALLWLVPTIGLFMTSLLVAGGRQQHAAGGRSSRSPSLATWQNYSGHLPQRVDPHSAIVTTIDDRGRRARFCRSSSPRSPATRSPGSSSRAATGSSSA